MKYPLDKYKFVIYGNKVIAISSYAGKTVRGVAKCHPSDAYDVETGKMIAALRCNQKIAAKRVARARDRLDEARRVLQHANNHYTDMLEYYQKAVVDEVDAETEMYHYLDGR